MKLKETLIKVEELKIDCSEMASRMDTIMGLKENIIDKINQFYSDSSNLI